MKTTTHALVCTLSLLVATSAASATIADLGADYIDATTQPDNYTYLQSNAVNGGTEEVLSANQAIGNGGNTGWGSGPSASGGFNLAGILGAINGGSEFEIFNDGFEGHAAVEGVDLLLHPTNGATSEGAYVIVRRTITADDLLNGTDATIAGSFRDEVRQASVTVFVYQNATELFTATGGTLNPGAVFNLNTTIAEGDTIDFIVWNNGGYPTDETALRATINVIPEPTSLLVGAIGLAGLGLRRRRGA